MTTRKITRTKAKRTPRQPAVDRLKTGPKPRQRDEGSKVAMLAIECTPEEKAALLLALNAKLGNSTRARFDFFMQVANNIDAVMERIQRHEES